MSSLIALDKNRHEKIRVDPYQVSGFGADLHMVPIVLSEFRSAILRFPVVLTKNVETGAFSPIILCGFEKGENLFFEKGAWNSDYLPLNIIRQPFFMGSEEKDGKVEHLVCVDEKSPSIGDDGEAVFDEGGNPTAYLKNIQKILGRLLTGVDDNENFVTLLDHLKLIQPLTLDIKLRNGDLITVKGCYTIDELELKTLSADGVNTLREKKYLELVYAMIFSLGHINYMVNERNRRDKIASELFAGST